MEELNQRDIDADAIEHQSKLLHDNALILSKLDDLEPDVKIYINLEYPDGETFRFTMKDVVRNKFVTGFQILLKKRVRELIRSIGTLNL